MTNVLKTKVIQNMDGDIKLKIVRKNGRTIEKSKKPWDFHWDCMRRMIWAKTKYIKTILSDIRRWKISGKQYLQNSVYKIVSRGKTPVTAYNYNYRHISLFIAICILNNWILFYYIFYIMLLKVVLQRYHEFGQSCISGTAWELLIQHKQFELCILTLVVSCQNYIIHMHIRWKKIAMSNNWKYNKN